MINGCIHPVEWYITPRTKCNAPLPPAYTKQNLVFWGPRRLVAGTTLLDNDGRELFNLPLGSEESTELNGHQSPTSRL